MDHAASDTLDRLGSADPIEGRGGEPVGYICGRFPNLSETAIINEIHDVRHRGIPTRIASLRSPNDRFRLNTKANELYGSTVYCRAVRVALSNLATLVRSPAKFFSSFAHLVAATISSPVELLKALIIFPLAVFIADTFRRERVGHVHCHFATSAATAAYVVRRLTGLSYSVTVHAHDVYRKDVVFPQRLRQADFVVANSEHNAQLLTEKWGIDPERISLVRTGVDVGEFRPAALKTDRFSILSVGRMDPTKGFPYLIGACRILRDRGYDIKCTIVAATSKYPDAIKESRAVRDLIESEGVVSDVTLLDAVSQDELIDLYQRSHLFVLPCVVGPDGLHDGLPSTIIEAMAAGLPVVSTPIAGIPEAVRPDVTGVLVPPRNADAIADAIAPFIHDRDHLQRLGKQARSIVESEWDIEKTSSQMSGLFRGRLDSREVSQVRHLDGAAQHLGRKKICVVSERLSTNADDGIKNMAFALLDEFGKDHEVLGLSEWEDVPERGIRAFSSNRLYLSVQLKRIVAAFAPDLIVYVPWTSATIRTLFRARALKAYSRGAKTVVVASQPSRSRLLTRPLTTGLRPDLVTVQSREGLEEMRRAGCRAIFVPPGVDMERFKPVGASERESLREQWGFPDDRFVVVHVGHLERKRMDVDWVLPIQRAGHQLVVVASPHTAQDEQMAAELERSGVRLIRDFIPRIETLYQAADCYLFPVLEPDACIGVPLSVLEAMACNCRIVATRFQGLPDLIPAGDDVLFVHEGTDLADAVDRVRQATPRTNALVADLTWERMAQTILSEVMTTR